MASNYGPNFGIRRADEHQAIREGRFKTPATGTQLVLGTCVEVDPAAAGFMRQAAAGVNARPGVTGLLISEDQFLQSIFSGAAGQVQGYDFYQLNRAPLGKYAVILSGNGCKVWLKNTTTRTYMGRTIPGLTMFAGTPVIGDQLGWNGTAWATTATAGDGFMEVVQIKPAAGPATYLEAVLLV
jgi:hypothetical protein